jgi:hypothetical protein
MEPTSIANDSRKMTYRALSPKTEPPVDYFVVSMQDNNAHHHNMPRENRKFISRDGVPRKKTEVT